ncbi:TPA: carbohydrate binding domain-containing protein [Photobacterium damselae]
MIMYNVKFGCHVSLLLPLVLSANVSAKSQGEFISTCKNNGMSPTELTRIESIFRYADAEDLYIINTTDQGVWNLIVKNGNGRKKLSYLTDVLKHNKDFIGCNKDSYVNDFWIGKENGDSGGDVTIGEELIKNGGFEQGATFWESKQSPLEAIHPASSYGLSNSNHGSVVLETDSDRNDGYYAIQQVVNVKKDVEYEITFDYAGRKGFTSGQGVYVQIGNKILLQEANIPSKWRTFKSSYKSPLSGDISLTIVPTGKMDSTGILIDNVSIKVIGK